jgi:hypothetical protein
MPANFDSSSNRPSGAITTAITANFYYAGGAQIPVVPPAAAGTICLADASMFTGLFATEVMNCQAGGTPTNPVLAVLIIRGTGVLTEGTIPVFQISTADGTFLTGTVGFNATTKISNFPIRINVAVANPLLGGPTGQHNCPATQAVTAFEGSGTANYTPNESLCLPSGAGQAVEPSMIVDSQGTIYVESIRGVPGGLDLWRWNQAADLGPNADGSLPFKYEGQPECSGIIIPTFCNTSGLAPGGGDGDIAVNAPDPSNMNIPNLAVVSLTAAEVTGNQSTNRADTFSSPNLAVAGVPFDDRMWIDGFDDPTHVYMEYHDFGTTSQIFVQRSNDGGNTYDNAANQAVDLATEPSAGPPTGNVAGQIKVDRSRCPSRGSLYQIFVAPDNPTDNAQNSANFVNAVYVAVANDVDLTSPTYTFRDYKVFSCGAGSTCPTGAGLANLFPALAVDNFGYLYAAWSDNNTIYYSFSPNHGQTWSPAMHVNQGVTVGKANVFPWVAADANGHVAVAWYGADAAGNSNTVPAATTHWNVFVAESVNGHSATPVFTQSVATDHVNHTGQISTGGLLGSSDRSLADFFQIAIDPTNHLVNIAYADNHAGTSVSYFTREKAAMPGVVTTGTCAGHL